MRILSQAILLLVSIFINCSVSWGQCTDLITNGDFDSGSQSWNYQYPLTPMSGGIPFWDDSMLVYVDNDGSLFGHDSIFLENLSPFSLINGASYSFSFKARTQMDNVTISAVNFRWSLIDAATTNIVHDLGPWYTTGNTGAMPSATLIPSTPNMTQQDHIFSFSGTSGSYKLVLRWQSFEDGLGEDVWFDSIQLLHCDMNINIPDDTICSGDCIDLVASTSGVYVDPVIYQWDNGITSTDSTVTVCPTVTTSYTVIGTDGMGDMDTATVTITVLPPPVADLGSDTVICTPPYVLDAGNTGSTYLWSDGSTNQSLSVDNSGTYWVVVDNGGCTDSTGVVIDVVDLNVDLGPDITACNTVNTTLDAGNPGATYLWSDGSTSQTLNVTSAGSYWVEASLNGCTDSDTIVLSVVPSPIVNLGSDTTLCPGATLLLDGGNPGSTYQWQDNSTAQTFTVTTSGTYWLTASVGACEDTDSIEVSYETIVVDLGPDLVTCQPDTIVLDANNPGLDYEWNDNSNNQTLSVTGLGTYWVEVTNLLSGCSNSDTIEITQGTISVFFPSDTTLCSNANLVLDAGNAGATYLWSDGSTNQTLTLSSAGTYHVAVSSGLCEASDTVDVSIQEIAANFVASDTSGCVPLSISFTDLSVVTPGNILTWDWNFGDGATSSNQNPDHIYLSSGTHDVSLSISSDVGCTADTTLLMYITGYPVAEASFVHTPNNPIIESDITFNNASINSTSWEWDFGDGTTSTEENPVHQYTDVGTYTITLVATNEFNCNDTTTYQLIVGSEILLFAPNAFTPDGDEHNNVWQYHISGINMEKFSVQIFNRWGELIWESRTPNEPWDGVYQGSLVQDGVYAWKMECGAEINDERKEFIGHINVLR